MEESWPVAATRRQVEFEPSIPRRVAFVSSLPCGAKGLGGVHQRTHVEMAYARRKRLQHPFLGLWSSAAGGTLPPASVN